VNLGAEELAPRPEPSTILVVEDEILVRLAIADYLRDCGYTVIEAADSDEAMVVLKSTLPVELVFSDVQMPGSMDGFGLARWMREHRPEVKVILTSGYTKSAQVAGDLCEEGPLLAKPYQPETVIERIRELLGRRAGD
jgi:CheY-like chemotaxis protein